MPKIIIKEEKNYNHFKDNQEKYIFEIKKDCHLEFVFDNFSGKINILIENSKAKINYLQKNINKFDLNIKLNNSQLIVNGLNLSSLADIKQKIILNDSAITFNEKSYPKELKQNIKINHLTPNSISNINCLGIGQKGAKFDLNVETKIKKRCDDAKAKQKLKIIALTDQIEAILKPILKINHHQVTGNHGVIFKRLKEEDLYYLLTRGLNQDEARKLIIRGNLLKDNEKYYQELEERL